MAKNTEPWIDDLVGTFCDPIIVMPGGWGDTLPDWIKGQITLERLIENMKATKGEQPTGTDAEACAYLYTAALTHPLDSHWTTIYLYVATRVMSKKGTEVPEDIKVESLTDYEMSQLEDLKRWLYRQRVKEREERRKAERRKEREEAAARAPKQLRLPF